MSVEELRKAREESANVAYITFVKHIQADKTGLFCFFEGEDSPYYVTRIKPLYNGNYHPIDCKGKKQVLKVYEIISYHSEYDSFKKGFFVDSDFDLPINNPHIFETPCYAIENFYTSPAVFADILKNEFRISEIEENFPKTLHFYQQRQNEFHDAILLFNAWYACLKDVRNVNNQRIEVNLDSTIPKDLISIDINGITKNYDIDAIERKYPNAPQVPINALNAKIIAFDAVNKRLVFRGKYEFDFMLKILEQLIEDSRTNKQYISKLLKYHITHKQAISQFSQYAETPPELIAYIRNITNDLIKKQKTTL